MASVEERGVRLRATATRVCARRRMWCLRHHGPEGLPPRTTARPWRRTGRDRHVRSIATPGPGGPGNGAPRLAWGIPQGVASATGPGPTSSASDSASSAFLPAMRQGPTGGVPYPPPLRTSTPTRVTRRRIGPGGAALAAFDAAVARGQIPSTYKDLVGDFGARYAPALARPTEGALAVSVDTERAARVGPQGGPMNLRVALVSSEAAAPRAPLSVHIVLDTSGSMSGPAIDDAKSAAEAVVAKLAPTDDFSMVTFSDTARCSSPTVRSVPAARRPSPASTTCAPTAARTSLRGSTSPTPRPTRPRIPQDAVRIVMLLSDGHANGGDTDPQHLAQRAANAFQEGVQTSSFGLGTDFDAALMSRIADRGAGGYYYLADSSQIAPALAREIDARLQPVATASSSACACAPMSPRSKVFGSRELSSPEAAAVRAQEVAIDQREKKHGASPATATRTPPAGCASSSPRSRAPTGTRR